MRERRDGSPASDMRSGVPRAVRRAYWLGLVPAGLALLGGMRLGARLGASLADGIGGIEGVGMGLGGIAVGWLAASAVLAIAVGLGMRVARRDDAARAELDAWLASPATRPALALVPLRALVAFPVTLVAFPLLPALAAASVWARDARPRLARVAHAAEGIACGALLLFVHGWSSLLTPGEELGFVVGGASAAALAVALRRAGRGGTALLVGAGIAIVAIPPWPVLPVHRAGIALLALPPLLAPRLLGGKRWMDAASPALVALFLVATAFWVRCASFAALPTTRPPDAPAERVYRSGDRPRADNRFLLRACDGDGWIVGTRERELGLIRLDAAGRERVTAPMIVGNNGVLDCDARVLVTSDYREGTIIEVDADDLAPRARHPVPEATGFMHVQLSDDRRSVFANDEAEMAVFRIDRASGASTVLVTGHNLRGFHVDEARERIYVSDGSEALAYDYPAGRLLARVDLHGPVPTHPFWEKNRLAMGADDVYVTRYLGGTVFRLDPGDLSVRSRAELGRGVRDLVLDAERGLLFVANYQRGFVVALDATSLAERGRIRVGRRTRQLEIDPISRDLLGTSVAGGFRIDVERWLDG